MNDSMNLSGSVSIQASVDANVHIVVHDLNTGEYTQYSGKNTVTKVALMGVIRLFNGEFGVNNRIKTTDYYPQYLAIGNGSRSATVTDTGLDREYTDAEGNKARMPITRRIINNIYDAPRSELTLKIFIPNYMITPGLNDTYNIQELGLFTDQEGETAFARVVLDEPVIKDNENTIDITWTFVVSSTFSGAVGG